MPSNSLVVGSVSARATVVLRFRAGTLGALSGLQKSSRSSCATVNGFASVRQKPTGSGDCMRLAMLNSVLLRAGQREDHASRALLLNTVYQDGLLK